MHFACQSSRIFRDIFLEKFNEKRNNFRAFSIVGLVIVTIGAGCLKPLGGVFGAKQYKPSEIKSIALFFTLYYFMLNCGVIISSFVNPILREDVECFGNEDCFALAFGIPAISMVILVLLVMVANKYSETLQTDGNTFLNVFACISVKLHFIQCLEIGSKHFLINCSTQS